VSVLALRVSSEPDWPQYRALCALADLHYAVDHHQERSHPCRPYRVRIISASKQDRADCRSFLAIFADVATIAVAYDRGELNVSDVDLANVYSSIRPSASGVAASESLDHLDNHGSVPHMTLCDI